MKRIIAAIAVVLLVVTVWAVEPAKDKTIALFNGKDFTGWKLFLPDPEADPAATWSVKNGVVHCMGRPTGYMRTDQEYENYRLRIEWRWTGSGGNSGVLLHCRLPDTVWPKSIEAQLAHQHAGDLWVIGGTDFEEHTNKADRRVPKKEDSSEKPLGEWNQYEIVCRADTVTIYVNGTLQNAATQCNTAKGYIALQSEGAEIEFRNITIERLD